MKHLRLLPLAAALAVGFTLLVPEESHAYSELGGKLNLDLRHVRVFNNFLDNTANNNQTPDPNFPGALGAPLAIWKGCVEWGSVGHGDGGGDPTQFVGSGGSNFDCTWQGETTGNLLNTHAEIIGQGGGVLAFAAGGTGGWRIFYYSSWKWSDGPGSPGSGEIDLQGVATHEYGHALGLGHSEFSNATMRPSIIGNGVPSRSIEADDIAGVQAIYGTLSPSKPIITDVDIQGDTITIQGTGFTETNEVWFTRLEPWPTGDGIVAEGVASTNGGTQITLSVPAGVGPGDLLVLREGAGLTRLSNPWPYDAEGEPLPRPGTAQPFIFDVNPTEVGTVVVGEEFTVTLTGEAFLGTDSLSVGGKPLSEYLPSDFVVLDDETIQLRMPQVDTVGPVEILLEKNGLIAASTIDVVAPDPPVVELGAGGAPEYLASFIGMNLKLGGEPGNIHFLWASPELVPSTLPGQLDLAIGNNFSSLIFVGALEIPAAGWLGFTLPFSGIENLPIYFQSAQYDPEVGIAGVVESNVAEGFIVL